MTEASQDSDEILGATVEALGYELKTHRMLHESVSGDGLIQAHEVQMIAPDGTEVAQTMYLETSPPAADREGVLVFRNEETEDEVAVWLYPRDPALPALPTAVYPHAAAVMLQKLGIDSAGLSLQLVAYRPGRRAVIRNDTAEATVFVKVVRPHTVAALQSQYQRWSQSGLPVPRTLGWSEDGFLGFQSLPGVAAHEVVESLGEEFLDSVEALIARYAGVESAGPARASLVESRSWYERRVVQAHPELATRIHLLTQQISDRIERSVTAEPESRITVHSDLHLGQLFVDSALPNQVTGILDIDTAGYGDPADDAAAFYAHLVVSALFEDDRGGDRGPHFERLAQLWRRRWAVSSDFSARAEAIAATHLLAHALGGLVPSEHLITRAESLLTS